MDEMQREGKIGYQLTPGDEEEDRDDTASAVSYVSERRTRKGHTQEPSPASRPGPASIRRSYRLASCASLGPYPSQTAFRQPVP